MRKYNNILLNNLPWFNCLNLNLFDKRTAKDISYKYE